MLVYNDISLISNLISTYDISDRGCFLNKQFSEMDVTYFCNHVAGSQQFHPLKWKNISSFSCG